MNVQQQFARRSFRGHLGRLKVLGQTCPAIMQHVLGIEQCGLTLFDLTVEDAKVGAQVPQTRNPDHFNASGRNLSAAGRAFIFGLYDEGFSIRGAAARIGISLKSSADYRSAWLRSRSIQIS